MYQKLSFEFAVLWNFSLSAIVSNRVTVLLELQRYVVEKKKHSGLFTSQYLNSAVRMKMFNILFIENWHLQGNL